MVQDEHEAPESRPPVGGSRSSSLFATPSTGMWDSRRQMQSPHAGTVVAGAGTAFGARLSPGAASEHVLPDNAWNQSAPIAAAHGGSGFLSLLGARNVTLPEMFEAVPAACDYLTGLGAAAAGSSMGGDAAYGLGSVDRYSAASVPPARLETARLPLVYSVVHGSSSVGCAPRYDHEMEAVSQRQGSGAPTAALLQQMIPSRVEIQSALGFPGMGSERERLTEFSFGVASLPDGSSFGDYRSSADFMHSNNNTHEQGTRPGIGTSSSGSGASSVATRRKSEGRVGANAKKSKQKAYHKASPPKPQAPQVKLGAKITTLQQIVSPFGKTDTSSVLFETIKYIKFLHEQLRLFSEPYTTKSAHKGLIRFGGEVEEETGMGHGLRGRGLCLVPVSLTSQVYRDDTLPDCWTPAYSSCLYQ